MQKAFITLLFALSCTVSSAAVTQSTGASERIIASAPAQAELPAALADFDQYIAAIQAEFDVPGIAIAIVKDDAVVMARGFGKRHMDQTDPVDENTLFAIASNTKAFTSAALSILADQGKISLDDRVIDHLPWFQMSDPHITREMRIRDLLSHRSGLGLGAGDLLFWPATSYSTEEVVRRLRHVPIKTSFRNNYAYDNILYAVAQLVIEKVAGKSYADFLQTEIFSVVGMPDTRVNSDALRQSDTNIATGHAKFDFRDLRPVAPMSWSNNSAAGGIYSNVSDMAKWMMVQLNAGVIDSGNASSSKRLFSEERHAAMWEVITPIAVRKSKIPELAAVAPNFIGYGEGWVLSDYRGRKTVGHTGGWPGMVSRVTLVPDLKLGVIVLTNQESGAAFHAATLRVLDAYLDGPETDWIAAYKQALDSGSEAANTDWQKHLAARNPKAKPTLSMDRYAGIYRDSWYGDVSISYQDKKLVIAFNRTEQLVGDLQHWQGNSFLVRWHDRSLNADAFANFYLDADGQIEELRLQAISPLTDFSFDFHDLRLIPTAAD